MRKLIFIFLLVACSSSKTKKTTYQITDWEASVPTNLNTWDCGTGWVKMVIYKDSLQYRDDTASNGDITHHKSLTSDTFYFLRTPDTNLPYKDSTGKQINDLTTHQPIYFLSWRRPVSVPKDLIYPMLPIPERYINQLNASIPKPTVPRETKSDTAHAKK